MLLERTLAVLEARLVGLARANLAASVTTWLNDYSNTFVERQVQPLAVSILAWLPAALLGRSSRSSFCATGGGFTASSRVPCPTPTSRRRSTCCTRCTRPAAPTSPV